MKIDNLKEYLELLPKEILGYVEEIKYEDENCISYTAVIPYVKAEVSDYGNPTIYYTIDVTHYLGFEDLKDRLEFKVKKTFFEAGETYTEDYVDLFVLKYINMIKDAFYSASEDNLWQKELIECGCVGE